MPASSAHCLHALSGGVSVWRGREEIGTLERGESAFAPAGVGAYRIVAEDAPAAVVSVSLPPYAD
jgi:mannose-6-phosphate isomerase-like protein (cupin superfamily)